jgi:hypothetical protein
VTCNVPKGIYDRSKIQRKTAMPKVHGSGIRILEIKTYEVRLEHKKAKGPGTVESICSVNPNGTVKVKVNRKPGFTLTFTKEQLEALASIAK